jgi:hypothetical protein
MSGLLVWDHLSAWWLVLSLPISLGLGLCGALHDDGD